MNAGSHIPWVPEVFFSLGATELSGEAASEKACGIHGISHINVSVKSPDHYCSLVNLNGPTYD